MMMNMKVRSDTCKINTQKAVEIWRRQHHKLWPSIVFMLCLFCCDRVYGDDELTLLVHTCALSSGRTIMFHVSVLYELYDELQ